MKKLIYSLLVLLAIGSIYAICRIGLGYFWNIGYSDNASNINMVLENLSYSYLAGCIFYILTTTIPNWNRSRKMRPIIGGYIDNILGRLNDCKKSVLPMEEYNTKALTDSEFISLMSSKSLYAPSALSVVYNGIGVGPYMRLQKNEILKDIDDVLQYQDYMSEEEIKSLSNLKTSTFFDLLKTVSDTNNIQSLMTSVLDNENIRVNIANALVEQIHSINKIKNSYGR